MIDSTQDKTFAETLQGHLENWRANVDGSRRRWWNRWTDGIYPAYIGAADEAIRADAVRLDSNIAHLRGSQAFAFNLFLPFRVGSRPVLSDHMSRTIGVSVSIDEVRFEWVPPGALLGEIAGDRPYPGEAATAVDVVLWGRTASGGRAIILVEVKLSEEDFTYCGGYRSRHNQRRDVCESAPLFFDNPGDCYLRRPEGRSRDRRYWEIFSRAYGSVREAFPGAMLEGGCPFAHGMNQPMRNLAIARGLEQDGSVDHAWFMLCSHDDNTDIKTRWDQWKGLLPDPSMAPMLPASEVVRMGESEGLVEWAAWMRERYLIPGGAR